MILAQISRDIWLKDYAKNAHMSVFGEDYPEFDTTLFDYALLVIDKETDTPIIYNLIRIMNTKSVYIEYGGSFPPFRASLKVRKAFNFLLSELHKQGGIELVILMTMTTNVAMQKLALATGFLPFGLTQGRYGLCLEYRLNLKKENQDGSMDTNGDFGGLELNRGGESGGAEKAANASSSRAN